MLPSFDHSPALETTSEMRWAAEPESLVIARAKAGTFSEYSLHHACLRRMREAQVDEARPRDVVRGDEIVGRECCNERLCDIARLLPQALGQLQGAVHGKVAVLRILGALGRNAEIAFIRP